MTRAAFAVMKHAGGGRVVSISTAGVYTGNPDVLLYLCAKAGVEASTRAFARLGAPLGITVNAVAPHVIEAGMGLETISRDPTIPKRIPLGRIGRVDELVNLVLFLSSECCQYLTGQVVHLNGGRLMR
jgi:3-oxoacyl-[acyl-carrier protein] reductase